jgi:hypothetical protein
MAPEVIAALLAQFGPPAITLVGTLITNIENKTLITGAQWITMISGIAASTAQVEMAKELMAAGITSTDPRYIQLIALTQPKAS